MTIYTVNFWRKDQCTPERRDLWCKNKTGAILALTDPDAEWNKKGIGLAILKDTYDDHIYAWFDKGQLVVRDASDLFKNVKRNEFYTVDHESAFASPDEVEEDET